jgi:hypothetical protein
MKPESWNLNLKKNAVQPTQRHREAKPQRKAGGIDRGTRELRGKQNSSRFAFRVFGVFHGLAVS